MQNVQAGHESGWSMTFTRITCAGASTMGPQVAWHMAFHGKQVTG